MKKYFLKRSYSKDYKDRDDVISVDVLPIEKEQLIKAIFISTNSHRKQGILLSVPKGSSYIEYNEKRARGIGLWYDTSTTEWILKCHSITGFASIYNIFEGQNGAPRSLMYKSGMLIEEKENIRIYHCNDVGDTDTFDSLVFSVEKL